MQQLQLQTCIYMMYIHVQMPTYVISVLPSLTPGADQWPHNLNINLLEDTMVRTLVSLKLNTS